MTSATKPTPPSSMTRRVIEHPGSAGSQRTSAPGFRMPDHWLRGLLAGAEGAILSWLVLVVPAAATYVATAASPALGSANWMEAARAGTGAWLLGHGAQLGVAGHPITIIPIGIALLSAFLVSASVRRVRVSGWPALGIVVGTYLAFTGLFVALAKMDGAPRALLGAVIVAAAGAVFGARGRLPALPDAVGRVVAGTPPWVRAGLRAGVVALAGVLGVATLATASAVVAGFSRILHVQHSLGADGVSTAVLIVAQVLLLPTLVVWSLAFLAGPGFALGSGTVFSPSLIDSGPLPVIPALGALPEPGSAVGSMPFLVVASVAVGAGTGWWLRRRAGEVDLARSLGAAVLATALCAVAVAALCVASSGAIGPGRMAEVGPNARAVALAIAWQVGAGAGAVVLLSHPATARAAAGTRAWLGRWADEVRGADRTR